MFQMEDHVMNPLFKVELLLETRSLYFAPNLDNFTQGLSEIIGCFQDTVLSVVNLVPDGYFDAFTRLVFLNVCFVFFLI